MNRAKAYSTYATQRPLLQTLGQTRECLRPVGGHEKSLNARVRSWPTECVCNPRNVTSAARFVEGNRASTITALQFTFRGFVGMAVCLVRLRGTALRFVSLVHLSRPTSKLNRKTFTAQFARALPAMTVAVHRRKAACLRVLVDSDRQATSNNTSLQNIPRTRSLEATGRLKKSPSRPSSIESRPPTYRAVHAA